MLNHVETQRPSAPNETASTASADGWEVRTLAAGDMLFREGDARNHVFRVEKGALCLFRNRPDGTRDVLEFAFPGDLVGLGYLDSHVSSAQATMETSLSCLPRTALEPIVEKNSRSRDRLTAAIAREVAFLEESLVRRSDASSVERVAALFVTLSRYNAYEGRDPTLIIDSLKCGVVADYLDMSVDHLAAQLAELEARGLIAPCDKGLRLKDVDALEKLTESIS